MQNAASKHVELAHALVEQEELLAKAQDRVTTLEKALEEARTHVSELKDQLSNVVRAYMTLPREE